MKASLIDVSSTRTDAIRVKTIDEHNFYSLYHYHNACELNYIVEGSGKCIVGDAIKNFSAGDLVLLGPNLPHIWYKNPTDANKENRETIKAIVIYFPANYLSLLGLDEPFASQAEALIDKSKAGLLFSGDVKQKVCALLEVIIHLQGLKKLISFLEIINILIDGREVEQLSSVGYRFTLNEKDTERMNNVYQYILEHFKENIELAAIASIANMTPPAFSNFFKKRTGKTFTMFQNELRVGHACNLLENLEYTIADVCFMSGFQNFANFNKFFRKITNQSPSQYRKEILPL